MKIARARYLGLAMCSLILGAFAFAQDKPKAKTEPAEYKTTIEGLVRDVACPIQNRKATATDFNMKCAVDCAKSGSPLIILTKEGDIYTPISSEMPDPSQREKMMPFVGKYVRATGMVYTRNGTRAIAITEIKELKDVKLRTSGD
jgi:hypothetical protein